MRARLYALGGMDQASGIERGRETEVAKIKWCTEHMALEYFGGQIRLDPL